MKKTISVILAAAMLSFVGCSGKDGNEAVTTTVPTTTESVTTEATVTSAETTAVTEEIEDEGSDIKIIRINYDFGTSSAIFQYPVYGDENHEAFDESMKNLAHSKLIQSGITSEDEATYEITDCDVKYESDTLVSVVFTGLVTVPTAAHPSHVSYTVNADPTTGKIYTSDELIGDISLIKTALAEGKFTQSYGIEDLLSEISAEDLSLSWREDYGIFPNMYFTEDSFGILVEVAFAIGGYAGFEISLADSDGMINDTAKSLLGN